MIGMDDSMSKVDLLGVPVRRLSLSGFYFLKSEMCQF